MSENDDAIDLNDLERRMEGAISALRNEFLSLRTGRASASIVEPVMVEAYGSQMPINQVGTVNVPDARMVTLNIWDKGLVDAAAKAIRESGLGINPVVDGTIIRLPIPDMNEERRRELSKVAAQYAERARIAVRNVRREGMEMLKKRKNEGLGEDDFKLWSDEVQTLTDRFIVTINEIVGKKQEEIMQV